MVYNVLVAGKISSANVAEILAPVFFGLSSSVVEQFFSANGLNGPALRTFDGPLLPNAGAPTVEQLKLHPLLMYSANAQFNAGEGRLSTDAIRESILAGEALTSRRPVSVEKYNSFFNPTLVDANGNGFFDLSEIGRDLGSTSPIAATRENFESLFFGSALASSSNISSAEHDKIHAYTEANHVKPVEQWYQGYIDLIFSSMQNDEPGGVGPIDKLENLKFAVANGANFPDATLMGLHPHSVFW